MNTTASGQMLCNCVASTVPEYEDGASRLDFMDHQVGRRIEADRSWTVYHVFTGIPAHVGGAIMIGLTRADATKNMLDLNRRNAERRRNWNGARLARDHAEAQADRS